MLLLASLSQTSLRREQPHAVDENSSIAPELWLRRIDYSSAGKIMTQQNPAMQGRGGETLGDVMFVESGGGGSCGLLTWAAVVSARFSQCCREYI